MNTNISDPKLFASFKDSTGNIALSITYPFPSGPQKQSVSDHPSIPGSLEADLAYPCFQVYLLFSHQILRVSKSEDRQIFVHILINNVIADLKQANFFAQFPGIRFEIYGGRPEFSMRWESGGSASEWSKAICDHAIREREDRNCCTTRSEIAQLAKLRVQDIDTKRRIDLLVERSMAKFHAPIMPVSFFSPPHQPWHLLALIVDNLSPENPGLSVMRFSKGATINDECTKDVSSVQEFDFDIERLSVGFAGVVRAGTQDRNVAVPLDQYLQLLDLANPETRPLSSFVNGKDFATASL